MNPAREALGGCRADRVTVITSLKGQGEEPPEGVSEICFAVSGSAHSRAATGCPSLGGRNLPESRRVPLNYRLREIDVGQHLKRQFQSGLKHPILTVSEPVRKQSQTLSGHDLFRCHDCHFIPFLNCESSNIFAPSRQANHVFRKSTVSRFIKRPLTLDERA